MAAYSYTTAVFAEGDEVSALRRDLYVGTWPPTGLDETAMNNAVGDSDPATVTAELLVVFEDGLVPGAEYAVMDIGDGNAIRDLFNAPDLIIESDFQYAPEGSVLTIIEGVPAWGYTTAGRFANPSA